jgi:mRNA-degrading endonuclease toxin of MazEF toxin-antitoxin module
MTAPPSKIPRFELWWVSLPHQHGHHQTGRRPAVVIADEPDNRFCIIAPLTTTLHRTRFKCTMKVEPTTENGLDAPSVVLGFQIRYLDRNRLDERIGRLSANDQAILDGLLAELLGFDG